MTRQFVTAFALTLATAASLSAQPMTASPAGSLTDATGVWTMQVESHQMGLELEQKGTKVEGVMLAMGQRILLVGSYVDRTLTLKGERPEDGATAGTHGGGGGGGHEAGKESGAGPIVATMKDDGTLDGELSTQRGRATWTGERLKTPQRPVCLALGHFTGEPIHHVMPLASTTPALRWP